MGWPTLAGAMAGRAAWIGAQLHRRTATQAALREPLVFFGLWFGTGCAALAIGTLAQTLAARPVFAVEGYAQAAQYLAQHAPRDSAVLFSGYRDGAFVFNMRAREDRRDLSVVRADKLLLRVAVRRELGVEQKALSEQDIRALIHNSGSHYVVVQPGFWNDLEVMRRFEAVLASPEFEEVARIPTPANFPAHEKELLIYRNKGPVATRPDSFQIDLPIIGRKIEGQ